MPNIRGGEDLNLPRPFTRYYGAIVTTAPERNLESYSGNSTILWPVRAQ